MALHAQMKYVGEHSLITVFDATAPLHSSNPSIVLVDDWLDLSEWGGLLSSNTMCLDAWLEKPDGQGGFVPCVQRADYMPAFLPTDDPVGYTVNYDWLGDTTTELDPATIPLWYELFTPTQLGNDPHFMDGSSWTDPLKVRVSRVRILARADCSSGLHDALGYRLHLRIRLPDLAIWSKEVPIPDTDNVLFWDEPLISLSSLGVTSYADAIAIIAVVKRNGRVIRTLDANRSIAGDVFDPPTYPIAPFANAIHEGQLWYNQQNGGNVFGFQMAHFAGSDYFVDYDSPPGAYGVITGGAWRAAGLAACNEYIEDSVKIAAWRQGAAFTEYVAVQGEAPVPVPVGSADGCTLLIKILRAPKYLEEFYPFNGAQQPWALKVPAVPTLGLNAFPPRFLSTYDQGALSADSEGRLRLADVPFARLGDVPEFVTGEILGDGTAQATAHGFTLTGGYDPANLRHRVIPVKWPAGSACEFSTTVDATNINVTMTLGVTYIIMAWRPI